MNIYQPAKLIDYNSKSNDRQRGVRSGFVRRDRPGPGCANSPGGVGTDGLKTVAVMGGSANGCKRDWSVDNFAEGAFEDALDEFFSREEVLAALCAANTEKVGPPFRVPDIVIEWGMMQVSGHGIGYRTAARRISRRMERMGLPGISPSQFWKRAGRIHLHDGTTDVTDGRVMAFGAGGVGPRPVAITVVIDSTAMSPDRPAGWKVTKWDGGRVRGWYKLHTAVDADTGHILAYVVTEPYYNDALAFDRLVDTVLGAGHTVARILADAAYDVKENWRRMESMGIGFVANINAVFDPTKRGYASGRFRGCAVRARHVLRIHEVGRAKWREEVSYSRRWRVEATYGDLKRMFGDTLRARARERVTDMMAWVVRAHNLYKSVRMGLRVQN